MCPQDDLLSAYLDGEIAGPWDRHLAAHIAGCARCRAKVASLRSVSERLRGEELLGIEAAAKRVRERIAFTLRDRAFEPIERWVEAEGRLPFYRRQVLLPVPLLAAGLALLFVLVGSLFFFVGKSGNDLRLARTELEDLKTVHVYYPVKDERQFLQVINDKNFNEDVVFELPETDNFKVSGEPEVIYVRERK